jgi:hypothetical protein
MYLPGWQCTNEFSITPEARARQKNQSRRTLSDYFGFVVTRELQALTNLQPRVAKAESGSN